MGGHAAGPGNLVVLQVGLDSRFYSFFIASRRCMFRPEDFGVKRCFLGRRKDVSPWLITILGEHVDFLQYVIPKSNPSSLSLA
jgi:hypothetical protein